MEASQVSECDADPVHPSAHHCEHNPNSCRADQCLNNGTLQDHAAGHTFLGKERGSLASNNWARAAKSRSKIFGRVFQKHDLFGWGECHYWWAVLVFLNPRIGIVNIGKACAGGPESQFSVCGDRLHICPTGCPYPVHHAQGLQADACWCTSLR